MRTSFAPVGREHEMVDGELASSTEQLAERLLAVGAVEDVLLVDLLPWKRTPFSRKRVPQARKCLLLPQKLRTCPQPLFVRDRLVACELAAPAPAFAMFALLFDRSFVPARPGLRVLALVAYLGMRFLF